MARPKPTRISGTGYDINTQAGKAAYKQMRYPTVNKQTNCAEIDTEKIEELTKAYIKANTVKRVNEDTGETETAYKPISRVGLRLHLGISRETYSLWLQGYVDSEDVSNEGVLCNKALASAVRAGDDAIIQYLIEQGGKYDQTKMIRLLETYGEIGPASSKVDINGNISLGKWGKRFK